MDCALEESREAMEVLQNEQTAAENEAIYNMAIIYHCRAVVEEEVGKLKPVKRD